MKRKEKAEDVGEAGVESLRKERERRKNGSLGGGAAKWRLS